MATAQWTSARTVTISVILIPIFLIFGCFIGYVSWSLHQFAVKEPKFSLNCDQLASNKTALLLYKTNRTVLVGHSTYTSNQSSKVCWEVKKKWFLPNEVPDGMEVQNNLLFIRIISKNYVFQEEVLAMLFSPNHFYCFPVGNEARSEFEHRVRYLGECILNVIVPPGRFNDSDPVDLFRAHRLCIELMHNFPWKHAVILQESEVPLQSVHFLADRLRNLGEFSKIGRDTVTDEETRIMTSEGIDSSEEEAVIHQSICEWLATRRQPLFISRALSSVFYRLAIDNRDSQELQHCLTENSTEIRGICISKQFDVRGNCISSMENLNFALRSKSLFIRADPRFDLGFVQCLHREVFRRTYNTSYYNIHYGN